MGDQPSCYNAGDHDGMTEIFHLILIYILATICFIEIIISIFLAVKELPHREHILTKFKIFMVPLLTTDFLIGCTNVLLFVLELSKEGEDVDCDISSWRIIGYLYYYVTRTIALGYICLLTYRKTRKPLPTPVQKQNEDAFTFVINISLLWSPGISALLCFGFTSVVESDSAMASLTLVYFLVTMGSSSACHIMVYRAISRDKTDEDNCSFTDTKYYRKAMSYVKISFVCFLALNVPLFVTAFIFVTLSFGHSGESPLVHDMYLTSLLLAAVESIGNPVLFVNNINKVKKGLCKTCSIIIFNREIRYENKSFNIDIQEVKKGKEGEGRPVAALVAAKNTRDEELNRRDNTKTDGAHEMSEASNQDKLLGGNDGVTFDGINRDITLSTETWPAPPSPMKLYDEAGIEIEEDDVFDSNTNPEPEIFGDGRNHSILYK